jgi:hypothetical protein
MSDNQGSEGEFLRLLAQVPPDEREEVLTELREVAAGKATELDTQEPMR